MAHLTLLLFPFGVTLARGLFAAVRVLRKRRQAAGPQPGGGIPAMGSPTSDPIIGYRRNPAAHTALSARSELQRQQLDAVLTAHAAGEAIDALDMAQLAGLLGRTPIGAAAVARAAAAGARGPSVADVNEVDPFWALQDPVDVVLTLDERCAAASSFRTPLDAQVALGGKIGGLLALVEAEPFRFSDVADLAREVLAYAPPSDVLGIQLWHRLAQLAAPGGGTPDPDPTPGEGGDYPDREVQLPQDFPEIAEQARRIVIEEQERLERERGIGHA